MLFFEQTWPQAPQEPASELVSTQEPLAHETLGGMQAMDAASPQTPLEQEPLKQLESPWHFWPSRARFGQRGTLQSLAADFGRGMDCWPGVGLTAGQNKESHAETAKFNLIVVPAINKVADVAWRTTVLPVANMIGPPSLGGGEPGQGAGG